MTQPQDKMRAEFEAWCAKDNPRYRHTDDGITSRRDWKVWQAACAQKSAQSRQDVQGDKPLVVRLAEDFAEDCILAGYVTTGADSHKKLMAAAQQDALDAARFRWLKECATEVFGIYKAEDGEIFAFSWETEVDDEFSSAVDAAIATQGASNV